MEERLYEINHELYKSLTSFYGTRE